MARLQRENQRHVETGLNSLSTGDGLPVLMIDRPERKINMNIIDTNITNLTESKKTMYKLTRAKGMNIKDLENGERVPVDAWALYTDVNTKGTEQTVLAIISGEKKYHSISPTFQRDFADIVSLMDGEDFAIIITKATSKAGREFVTCELDCE